ncbi:hypothetical protein, partial [Mycobacterium sp.]|uniref:hypothetical protein n=1 Tax=Mycobacterium sp. TaxID=1785 RepID=UPI003F9B81DC
CASSLSATVGIAVIVLNRSSIAVISHHLPANFVYSLLNYDLVGSHRSRPDFAAHAARNAKPQHPEPICVAFALRAARRGRSLKNTSRLAAEAHRDDY